VNSDWYSNPANDQENQQIQANQTQQRVPLSEDEKGYIKANIFSAMDAC